MAGAVAAGGRVAYVAYTFPVLTQTFTVREVSALRAAGLAVDVFAAKAGDGLGADPDADVAAAGTTYLPHPLAARSLGALAGFALRRPLRLAATAFACLGGGYADRGARLRLAACAHVLLGAALAAELRRRRGYGRVHAQFVDAGSTVAFVAARLLDLRFSFANHTAYNPFLLRPKCRHADLVVSISDFDRDLLLRQADGAAVPSSVVVCRVGIRCDEWAGVERRPEPRRVLCVAALREKKGHAVLLRAAAALARSGRPVRLVIAGTGPEEASLRAAAARDGLDVEFLGPTSPGRVRAELGRAAVFALPCVVAANGDLDGLPVALMEAMAAGVPVVTSRLSGIPELVEDGVTGLSTEPGDADATASAIDRLLSDPGLAERCAAQGRRRVAELHDLATTSARLAGLLRCGAAGAAT